MNYTFSGSEHKLLPIEQVRKGDYFRLKGGKQVYSADGYCRENKKYCGTSFDDFCKQTYKKKGMLVEVNFEF